MKLRIVGYSLAGLLIVVQLLIKMPEFAPLSYAGMVMAAFLGGMGFLSGLMMFWMLVFRQTSHQLKGRKELADVFLLFADATALAYFAYKLASTVIRGGSTSMPLIGPLLTVFFLYIMPLFKEQEEITFLRNVKLRILKGYYKFVRDSLKERVVEYVLLKARIDTIRMRLALHPAVLAVLALLAFPLLPAVAVIMTAAFLSHSGDLTDLDRYALGIALGASAVYHAIFSAAPALVIALADIAGSAVALYMFLEASHIVRKVKRIL